MGLKKYLNRAAKKTERETEPESVKLFRELEDFYREHPKSTPSVRRHVDAIRAKCDAAAELLQAQFEKDQEAITAKHLKEELDFVCGFLPGYVPKETKVTVIDEAGDVPSKFWSWGYWSFLTGKK